MGRPKKIAVPLTTLEHCNQEMARLRAALLELDAVTVERDRAVATASALFEARIDEAKAAKTSAEAALQAFYYGNLTELEKDGQKHVQLANGRFGRRDNPPALKPLNRKWSWPDIAKAVRAKFGLVYFREKDPELDRQRLKDARLAVEELKQLGLQVVADETFYVEPAMLPAPAEVQ